MHGRMDEEESDRTENPASKKSPHYCRSN